MMLLHIKVVVLYFILDITTMITELLHKLLRELIPHAAMTHHVEGEVQRSSVILLSTLCWRGWQLAVRPRKLNYMFLRHFFSEKEGDFLFLFFFTFCE